MRKILALHFLCISILLFAQTPILQVRPANIRDGINYKANGTVILSLFAPYKSNVYVIGDFNNWIHNSNYLMKKDVVNIDQVYWWIELTGLDSTREYAFQYLIDGSLRVADPYTEKVLDPTHDAWIDLSTYPNMKAYPAGQSEIVSILYPSQTQYTFTNTNTFVRPAKEKLTIYELHLRDFISTHRFKTLSDTLAYLKRLGVNAIELMPINEFEGNSSWGYNPSFYFAVDKYYGPADELKRFIDKCHGEGMAVIIDLVLNHSYSSSPLVRMYFDGTFPTSQNPWYNRTCVSEYCWGNDFNHTTSATQYFVDRVTEHWLKNYHFDGIRFDFTQGFTQTAGSNWAKDDSRIAIVDRMSNQIWSADPTAYIILEHWTDNSEETILADKGCMLWGNLTHAYQEGTMGYNDNSKSDLSQGYYKNRNWKDPRLVTYMESHDEERILYKSITYGNNNGLVYDVKNLPTALSRSALGAAFLFTIPGPKMLWQFQELGYDYSIDYNQRVGEKPIRWDYLNNSDRKTLYDDYSKLIKLRLNNAVFTSPQTNVTIADIGSNGLKKIILKHSSMNVVIIGNFGVTQGSIDPTFPAAGNWYDYVGNNDIVYNGTDVLSISLAPGEYRIYTSVNIRNTVNTAMYVAGTFNGWNTSSHPMQLVADRTWQITGVALSAASYNIKFTNAPSWSGNDWGSAVGLSGTALLTTGGGANISFTISKSGNYSIRFNDSNLSYVISEDVTLGIGIQNSSADDFDSSADTFELIPNPATDHVITLKDPTLTGEVRIEMQSAQGVSVYKSTVQFDNNEAKLHLEHLPTGLYILIVQKGNRTFVKKVIL